MSEKVNLGGVSMKVEVLGVDESLEKLNLLTQKIAEVNSLIRELNSAEIKMNVISDGKDYQVDD